MKRARTDEAKDERRQLLLDAALDEFVEHGYTAARMDDIANRAGLSKGALYLYFASKKLLFLALIETIAVPNAKRIEKIISETDSVVEAIHLLAAIAPDIISHTPMPRIIKVLLCNSHASPDIVKEYRMKVIDRILGALTGLLERGKLSGEVDIQDPRLTARLIIAPVVMSAIWQILFTDDDSSVDLQELFKHHEHILLAALKT